MIRKSISVAACLLLAIVIAGCQKKSSPTPQVANPAKAALTFPAQDAVCTTGTIISATQSSVTFTWQTAANTSSYELNLKNLLTGTSTTQTTTSNQLAVKLSRNTPYSWYIVSKSEKTSSTAQSDTWKFYNSGLGTVSHSPFPAELVSPGFGLDVASGDGTIKLQWKGSDVDGDITGYDLYFGTTVTPALYMANVKDMFMNGISVKSGTTYYWNVITTDSQGNTSNSGLFQFKIK
ncbi:hypothetical protein [Mucilaginibacter ginsenosidivorax]|uniref:Fibronectin type-III domain-containing protein n=1 Tax=Mucilaginibacter ginsenosidivorax TaxID=862126 RepID=A0A5B8W6G6_9SPHI|nr:hypothetical protein [Mucilaginibacter ginsenosidivorax]QEC79291.1 hypothetical protein FSB76_26310 [Mucilaginibacter ginsenosidivorax]